MSSSVSKARDARDGRVSQPQRAIDTVVDTAKDDVAVEVEELALHPAAAIFRNEALAGVGDENAALEEENSRFRHLRDISQKLDITFSTASSERQGPNEILIHYHETMRVETLLSNGSVVLVDDSERLVIPINDASAHPIDDCGTLGDISGNLAGMTIGSFPGGPYFHSVPKVRVDDDGSVQLTLHLSTLICIEGRLDAHISNDALAAYVERGNFMSCMRMPFPLFHITTEPPSQTNGITFTPTSISMSLTPRLKKTLTFISEVVSSAPSDFNEDLVDNMRRLVVEALGGSEHKELLSKNLELKCESAALAGIRNLMLGIDVSHSEGTFSVSLDEGEKLTDNPMWRIALDDKENMSLPVADMGSIGLSFSGTPLNKEIIETIAHVGRAAQPIVFRRGRINFILFGIFNWADFSEDEISEITEDWHAKMRSVLVGNGEDLFPATMKFRIESISCELSLAEDLLRMVGLVNQPLTNE